MGDLRGWGRASVLTGLAAGSAVSSLGGGRAALLPSTRGDSSSCSRFSWSGELHLELKSRESGRRGGLGGGRGRDGEGEWEAGAWGAPQG